MILPVKETPKSQQRLLELIEMYNRRSERMVRELLEGRKKAKERIRDNNYIGGNEHETIDGVRHDYQLIIIYVGSESVRMCYVVQPDRIVIFWYWRSNDPLTDPRIAEAFPAVRRS